MKEHLQKVHVMKGFLLYFRVLKVYNVERFRGPSRKIIRNICQLLFVLTLIVSQVTFMFLMYWTYLETRNPYILSTLSIGYQMSLTHLSGASNNRLISETLRRLQNAINCR